jgi:hypothetical protein
LAVTKLRQFPTKIPELGAFVVYGSSTGVATQESGKKPYPELFE